VAAGGNEWQSERMPLVWVTGSAGVGKSSVCAVLKGRGEWSLDADWDGFNYWVDRATGEVRVNPPYPVPAGWLARFAWRIDRSEVQRLARQAGDSTVFLCGSVENEVDVWDLFNLVICLVADNDTIRQRLQTRTTNSFGKHPEELAAALGWNADSERIYRRLGATIIDGRRPLVEIVDEILAAASVISSR
jgi:hypothetical protein